MVRFILRFLNMPKMNIRHIISKLYFFMLNVGFFAFEYHDAFKQHVGNKQLSKT